MPPSFDELSSHSEASEGYPGGASLVRCKRKSARQLRKSTSVGDNSSDNDSNQSERELHRNIKIPKIRTMLDGIKKIEELDE